MPAAVEHVRKALRTAAIRVPDVFAKQTRLVIGFSGGQDSTCLLHALARSHRRLELLAVHVDHGLRSGSAADAERAVELATSIGVPAKIRRVSIARKGSLQASARTARYEALAQAAHEHGARAVLVAHTADDQAETVLLNLLRGSGLLGLAAMRMDEERGDTRLVRPLLRVARSSTLAYCDHFGLDLVEDVSNRTRAYTRNRVRLDLLPLLEQFNPAIRTVLARTADLAVDDNAVLQTLAENLMATVGRTDTFPLETFRAQPRALQRRVLRVQLETLVGGLVNVNDAPIEDALNLLQTGQPNQTYHLPYGVELCIGPEAFMLRLDGRARHRQKKSLDVRVPRV